MDLLLDMKPAVLMSRILGIAQHARVGRKELFGSVVEHVDGVIAVGVHRHTGPGHSLQAWIKKCHHEFLRLLVLCDRAICLGGVKSETPFPVGGFR